jgi:hypothetical protein
MPKVPTKAPVSPASRPNKVCGVYCTTGGSKKCTTSCCLRMQMRETVQHTLFTRSRLAESTIVCDRRKLVHGALVLSHAKSTAVQREETTLDCTVVQLYYQYAHQSLDGPSPDVYAASTMWHALYLASSPALSLRPKQRDVCVFASPHLSLLSLRQ